MHRLRAPLLRPYRLAFGDLLAFDTLLVEVGDSDGRSGFGEATLLGGYGDEDIDGAWPLARELADRIASGTVAAARAESARLGERAPFTATAFMTALEMLDDCPLLRIAEPARVPLLGLLNADDERTVEAECDGLMAQGYRTLKLKIGLPGSDHLSRVRMAQRAVAGRARIRIDANQAFSGPEAAELLAALDPQDIELFEQPCAAGDWDAHAQAARAAQVPLMLDESIYGMADIERAAAEGAARYIKLKLVKLVALADLEAALAHRRARHARCARQRCGLRSRLLDGSLRRRALH